ncbi:MAG TPA: hypothetical protein VF252_08075 [Gemmatimonadales bacterium]
MAKSVKDLVARTMGGAESAPPSSQTFPPLEVEQIARMLRLDERAENAGRARLPAADAEGPDGVELEVLGVIEEAARKANEDYLSQRDFYEGRIRRAAITPDLKVQLEAAGANALADFRAEIIHDQNTLHTLLQAAGNREAEYQEFRQRHNLNRLPRNISQGQRTFAFMVLAVFVIVESILNGMFFAEGSEAGIIGGVMQALVLSILNVGVAALYAIYGLPFLFHCKMWGKAVGVLATVAFAVWLLGLNLAIGHFRDLFVQDAGNVQMAELLRRLTSAPLLLGDAKSGLLVLLGIALGLLSVIDVAASHDPYPGYGAIGRERQRAIERYAHENAKSLAAIMRLRDQTVDDMTAAIELMRSAQFDMQQAIEGRARLHHNYRAYLEHLAVVHERLIQRYRDGNRRVRRGDVPPYFRQPPARPSFIEPPVMSPMPGMEPDVRPEVIRQIDEDIKAVNEKFAQTVPEYQTVGQLASLGGSISAAT